MDKVRLIFIALVLACTAPAAYADIQAALAAAERSEADAERDQRSKPGEVLGFFGIKPGMRVADLFTGGGYYSEVLAIAVGPEGHVTAHNNGGYANFAGDAPANRFRGRGLDNLEYMVTEADDLQLPGELDAIIMVMSFHDTYWIDPEGNWTTIDNEKFNSQLFAALRSGGVLGIVDHAATAGSGTEAVASLHRIDKAFVVAELEAVGLRLDAEGDMLANAEDDYSKLVFDPAVRGKTDRFVLRFVKP